MSLSLCASSIPYRPPLSLLLPLECFPSFLEPVSLFNAPVDFIFLNERFSVNTVAFALVSSLLSALRDLIRRISRAIRSRVLPLFFGSGSCVFG